MDAPRRANLFLAALTGLTLVTLAVSLWVGPSHLPVFDVLFGREVSDRDRMMVLDIRLPRAILGLLVGSCLALSGAVYQGLFRNPLADPFVVGTSGGAALGAVLVGLFLQGTSWLNISAGHLAAFAGAAGTAWIVYRLAASGGRLSLTHLLLAGFVVGTFASSCVSIALLFRSRNWNEILFWLMGHLSSASWAKVRVALPLTAISLAIALAYARDLNLMLFGEETAQQLGSDVERGKRALFLAGSLATATAVAAAGIIGFLGLIVPHVVRSIIGPDHRKLLPTTFLGGGLLLVWADMVARLAWPPLGLPVGAVTALLGPPFFLILLLRRPLHTQPRA
jgi:iron complex transport system permease protein